MAKINSKALRLSLLTLSIIIFSAVLFSWRLSEVPVHLNQDELEFSLNAHSIATSLKDTSGNFLPFYFRHLGGFWATPVIVYLTSIVIKLSPTFSESVIRVPSVLVAVLSVSLVMLIVNELFNNTVMTILSGFFMATTPSFFIHSRLLLDNSYTILFVLIWLLFLYKFKKDNSLLTVFFSTFSLGVGIHSYHAGKIVMPIYFVLTLWFLFAEKKKGLKFFLLAFLGFLAPVVIFIPWLLKHPETLLSQISYVSWLDKSIDAQRGILGVFNFSRFSNFITSYFSYLTPKVLFLEGDRSLIHSTGKAGVFLAPIGALLFIGIPNIIFKIRDNFSKIILIGFFTYPIAPSLINEPQRISRGLVVIPFAILIAAYGLWLVIKSAKRIYLYLLAIIVLLSSFQFVTFLKDYFGDYRLRSYTWFNYDINTALELSLDQSERFGARTIYLDANTPFIDRYFSFVKLKKRVSFDNWQFFDYKAQNFRKFPSKSLLVLRKDHTDTLGEESFAIKEIIEPDGKVSFLIYYVN